MKKLLYVIPLILVGCSTSVNDISGEYISRTNNIVIIETSGPERIILKSTLLGGLDSKLFIKDSNDKYVATEFVQDRKYDSNKSTYINWRYKSIITLHPDSMVIATQSEYEEHENRWVRDEYTESTYFKIDQGSIDKRNIE